RHRRPGARLLPPVPEPQARVPRGLVERRELAGGGSALRGGRLAVDDLGARDEIGQPAPATVEQHGHEAEEEDDDRNPEEDGANEGAPERRRPTAAVADTEAEQLHAGRSPGDAPER